LYSEAAYGFTTAGAPADHAIGVDLAIGLSSTAFADRRAE
jgi:hypothetical protein